MRHIRFCITKGGGILISYVLQKINADICKDPYKFTENIVKIIGYQRKYYKDHKDASRRCLTTIETYNWQCYFVNEKNEFWCVFFCTEV